MKKRFVLIVSALMLFAAASVYAEPTPKPEEKYVEQKEMADETPSPEATAVPQVTSTPEPTQQPTPQEEPQDPEIQVNSLDLTLYLKKHALTLKSKLEMSLYDENGTKLSDAEAEISGAQETVKLHFELPSYQLGKKFRAEFSGVRSITFLGKEYKPGAQDFYIETFYWRDENGVLTRGFEFEMNADPLYNKEVYLFTSNGNQMYLSPGSYLAGDTAMVPVKQVAAHLGLNVRYVKEYNAVDVYIGDKILSYKLGSTLTNVFGKDKHENVATNVINGTAFVTARSIADAFGSTIKVWENDERIDIMYGTPTAVNDYYNQYHVNRAGIASNTKYLIWVSKSEYKVRVYQGSKGRWVPIRTAPCAIGAPSTPTVTGQFTYFSKERWDYSGYYVGPVMRFYNGYALHSTLLNYDGTEYDGRVGVMISHGCVRLHPADINWLAANIPYGTKIYITE
ncbi:MAG: L,D-transpeptidase family protein [Clostridiales bacterium]|nr:L,D-transpeptidase family protein [Clostridiales bacterium]